MAFNINAHVILQGPKNIQAVTNSIKGALKGINVPVNIQVAGGSKAAAQVNKQIQAITTTSATAQKGVSKLNTSLTKTGSSLTKTGAGARDLGTNLKGVAAHAQQASGAMHMLGRETALTMKRFGASAIVTATIFKLASALSEATGKALEFEREMTKLQQITGQSQKQLAGLKKSIGDISVSLGIGANDLASISRLFAQTGQSLREVRSSMEAIARSSLAPTFGEMENTAEGLIATLAQFNIRASQSEEVLGAINRVSKKFAVESQDMIAAVRRAGGVFALAAKDTKTGIQSFEEFISVFTAVRSTTRESAETIATGLRTIFTRIQRRGTIEMLRSLGINLTDVNGKFIGLFESFKTLSTELDKIIQKGDAITLSAITEELGGMRQVGKLIPAIREFKKAERALDEAKKGAAEGLGKDVELGLKPLAKQFEQLVSKWDLFVRKMTEGSTFQKLASMALDTANAFIDVADALRPIMPMIATLGAAKLARGLVGFGAGFMSSSKGVGARYGGGVSAGVGARLGGGATVGGGTGKGASQGTLSNAMANNTSALTPNTKQLELLRGSVGTLVTHIDNLKGPLDGLKIAIEGLKAMKMAPTPYPLPIGRTGGVSRGGSKFPGGRTPFRRGGRVPMAKAGVSEYRTRRGGTGHRSTPYSAGHRGPTKLVTEEIAGDVVGGKRKSGTGLKPSKRSQGRGMQTTGASTARMNESVWAAAPHTYGAVFLRASDSPSSPKKGGVHFRTIHEDLKGQLPVDQIISGMSMFKPGAGKKISEKGMQNLAHLGQIGKESKTSGQALGAKEWIDPKTGKHGRGAVVAGARGNIKKMLGANMKDFDYVLQARSLTGEASQKIEASIHDDTATAVNNAAKIVLSNFGTTSMGGRLSDDLKQINIDQIVGNIFEGALSKAGVPWNTTKKGGKGRTANETFDFTSPGILNQKTGQGQLFGDLGTGPIDAKATYNEASLTSMKGKVITYITSQVEDALMADMTHSTKPPPQPAAEGSYGPTTPFNKKGRLEAVLMPGEMQIQDVSPKTAKEIAAGNLDALFAVDPKRVSLVPGTGSTDSVEADLAPGSFIVRKDIAQQALAEGYGPKGKFAKRLPMAGGGHVTRMGFKRGGRIGFKFGKQLGPGLDPEKTSPGQLSRSGKLHIPGSYGVRPSRRSRPTVKPGAADPSKQFEGLGLAAKNASDSLNKMGGVTKKTTQKITNLRPNLPASRPIFVDSATEADPRPSTPRRSPRTVRPGGPDPDKKFAGLGLAAKNAADNLNKMGGATTKTTQEITNLGPKLAAGRRPPQGPLQRFQPVPVSQGIGYGGPDPSKRFAGLGLAARKGGPQGPQGPPTTPPPAVMDADKQAAAMQEANTTRMRAMGSAMEAATSVFFTAQMLDFSGPAEAMNSIVMLGYSVRTVTQAIEMMKVASLAAAAADTKQATASLMGGFAGAFKGSPITVSYTHLTLPTIYSV